MRIRKACLGILILFGAVCEFGHAAIEPDFLMDSVPDLRVPDPVANFNPSLKRLWLAALDRPEIDMQRMAAETIARAHPYGVPGLEEAVPRLEQILIAESSHPAARFASARALIVLKSESSSEKLLKASQSFGSDLRLLIEPVLAEWKSPVAIDIWKQRLQVSSVHPRELLLAIRGVGQLREATMLPTLIQMAQNRLLNADIRLEAATAAGQIAESGLEPDCNQLLSNTSGVGTFERLCVVRLLARHRGDAVQALLISLASDAEPAVAAAALGRLNEIDPDLVLPLAETAIRNPDPAVRGQAAYAYLQRPSVERIQVLGELLGDPHPAVRRRVSEGFLQFKDLPELNDAVLSGATKVLNADRWQGHEQAALLFGALEYRPPAKRLVELLDSPRPEVMIATAWALRKLSVEETVPGMIDVAFRQSVKRREKTVPGVDDQVAHLFEALGQLRAKSATKLLEAYVPKKFELGERSRSAAVEALGWIYENEAPQSLSDSLLDRINDVASQTPELALVRQMCTISLGRMKSVNQAAGIREFVAVEVPATKVGLAMRWAIKELTGEELPPPKPTFIPEGNWFLVPKP